LVAVAASLAQRKRWHLGSVEMLLGVKNERDPEWSPPPGQIPDWVTPRHIRAYRWLWWLNFRWAFLANNLPPLFYTFLSILQCWSNRMWINTSELPLYTIVIPRLALMSIVTMLANSMLKPKDFLSAAAEYFTYAPIRAVGTFEAVYAHVTGKQLKWGNTGGIRNGSMSELYVLGIVVALAASLLYSFIDFFFVDTSQSADFIIVVWGFALYNLSIYWPFARVSVQEFLGWSYDTLTGRLTGQILLPAGIMLFATMLKSRQTM